MTSGVLLRGGHIYSSADPFATAMLILDGRIAWVGDDAGALVHHDAASEHIDLRGALVTPAFVDAHVHATSTGLALTGLDLADVRSIAQLQAALAQHLVTDSVVLGHGWDQTGWPDGRPPSSADIDAVVGDRPVYLTRVDVHSAVISSALLAQCHGIESLPGFDPSGLVSQEAHHLARDIALSAVTTDQRRRAQEATLVRAAACGIASLHELAGPTISSQDDLAAVLQLSRSGEYPEVVGYWGEIGAVDVATRMEIRGLAGDLFVDGAIGSHTACLRAPYTDAADTCGAGYLTTDQIRDHVILCTCEGLQAGFHVIGDHAADLVMTGFREAAAILGDDRIRAARHRLEHIEMVDPDHIATLASLGIVGSVQPAFDAAWGGPDGMYVERLGRERASTMNPFSDMVAAGVIMAFGSDAPVTPLDPWGGVRAAAFHRTLEQRISVRAAFAAHTRGGRRAAGQEADEPGVLTPGAPATYAVWAPGDLVVQAPDGRIAAWSTDPRSGTPGLPDLSPDMPLPTCWRTVSAGRTIFDAGAWS